MRLEFTDAGGVTIARVAGDIDSSSAGDLAHEAVRAVPDVSAGLVLDLTDVRYVDSGGVRVFFELAAQLEESGRPVALAVPEISPLRRLIKITRLEEAIILCTSADECAEMVRQTRFGDV